MDEIRRGQAEVAGEEAEHLTRVLRAEPGQRYELSDGARLYLGEIVEARKRAVRFQIIEELAAPALAAHITLFLSLIKFDRFEWAIEKVTELGVSRIVPLRAERSEHGLDLAARKRVERWAKIARAAAQQARRVEWPEISTPIDLREAANQRADRRYFFDEKPGAPLVREAIREPRKGESIAVTIGPEGGWTDRERDQFSACGWTPLSLGPRILRAETAAVAAVALISHAWEDC